jgi:dihydropteroate synthase
MHNPGVLGSSKPLPGDPIEACLAFFTRSIEIARRVGIKNDRIAVDPGFGFGKSPEQNLELIARIGELHDLGFPILIGASRKSFIGKVTGGDAAHRLVGTIITNVLAVAGGAAIVRVHDVAEHVEAMRMVAAVRGVSKSPGRPA